MNDLVVWAGNRSTTADLRDRLVERVRDAEMELHGAREALAAHDAAVDALSVTQVAEPEPGRRDITALVDGHLCEVTRGLTVDELQRRIGGVKARSVEAALDRLKTRGRAVLADGQWFNAGVAP